MANKSFPKTVSFSTAILFDQPMTYMPEHTISAPITFTIGAAVDPDGDQPGYGTMVRLVADGVNTPDFSAFEATGSGAWVNTAGTVNRVVFMFDGVDYCVAFLGGTAGTGGGGGDITAPVLQTAVIENATPSRIDLTYDENLDTGSTPATSDFAVLVDGVASNPVTGVAVTGMQVRVTLTTPLAGGEVVLISYVGGTNKIQDIAGNDAVNLSNEPVTNNVVGGGGIDAEAQLIIDAINLTAAGPLTGTDETDINDLVVAMKAAGTWTLRDLILIPVWSDADANAINWKNPAISVNWQGGTTHGASGVSGVAISVNDLSAFAHVAQDSINLAVYLQTGPVPPALECYIGTQDSTNTAGLYYYTGPGGAVGGGFNNAEGSVGTLSPAAGYEAVNRVVSGQFTINRAGVNALTKVVASTGVPTSCKLRVGAMGNNFGTQNYPGSAVWSAALAGGGQTGTEMGDEYTAIQAFMTARGIDV